MMWMVVPTMVLTHTFKRQITSLTIVALIWFGRPPRLPPRCAKASLRVLYERLTSSIKINYYQGDDNRLYMESWNLRKYLDKYFWRQTFQVAVFFDVYFFESSFSLLFLATSLHCTTLAAMRYIPKLESGVFLVDKSFYNLTSFWWSISIYSLLISWIRMIICFLTAP